MEFLIVDKQVTRGINNRLFFHDSSDRLEVSREIYGADSYLYEVYEVLHETFSKDKLVINGRDNPVHFHGNFCKFRVIR
jgi:hypothetical protein